MSDRSTVTVTGVDLATTSGGADAVAAQNGGSIFIHGGTINSNTGAGTAGIRATGVGSQVTADQGLQITTSAVGAWALAAGSINLDNVAIANSGNLPFVSGIRADAAGSTVTANNVSINLTSDSSDGGVLAEAGGKVVITNSNIMTSGVTGFGLHASQSDPTTSPPTLAQISATNVTVTTTGNSGLGVVASDGALVNLNTVNVSTSGATAYGLFVEGFAAYTTTPIQTEIDGTGVTVHATGDTGYGAVVVASGVLNLNNSLLSATGANAGGVFVSDSGSVATLTASTITSAQQDAGVVEDSGHLFATNSVLSGNRNGVSSSGGTAADPNIISVSGGSLTAVNGDAFNAQDTIAQITLKNGTVVSAGSGNLLNVISSNPSTFISNVIFNVRGITAAGNIISDAASVATVNLSMNTTITGVEQNTFTTIDPSSTWIMNGNSDIHSLTLAGQALFTPPTSDPTLLSSYKTLTTMNYVGQGGVLGLNTYLGTDGSPSDILVINGGNASGNSFLRVANTTGAGAVTTGNGILVVQAINGGTTNPGAFALAGPVFAGPYEYDLFRSSVDPSGPQNWYLRSTINCTLAPTDPQCIGPVPPPPPDYRPQTSLYAAIPSMALLYGHTLLDTLHERVGDEEDLDGAPRLYRNDSGGWGRLISEHGNIDNGDPLGVLGEGPKFNYVSTAFQVGQDLYRRDWLDGSRDHAGLYGALGMLTGNVTHLDGTSAGTDQFTASTIGAYWTHFGPTGWYLDAIAQGTRYDIDGISGDLPALATNGWGFAGSLEGGYPFRFGNFVVEPQAQAIYQNVKLSEGTDTAATIQFRNIDSFIARFGARFANTWYFDEANSPLLVIAWFRPSLWHEFLGDSQTLFSSADGPVPFQSNLGGNWVQLTAGVDAKITKAGTLFANFSYETGTAPHGDSYAYTGKVGLRIAW